MFKYLLVSNFWLRYFDILTLVHHIWNCYKYFQFLLGFELWFSFSDKTTLTFPSFWIMIITNLLLVFTVLFEITHMILFIYYLSFCDWFVLLNIVFIFFLSYKLLPLFKVWVTITFTIFCFCVNSYVHCFQALGIKVWA